LFRGTSSLNLDDKGRLTIPTKYRAELQESCDRQMVVTVGLNERAVREQGCLWLYPLPEWEKVEQTVSKLPNFNKAAENLRRYFIGSATECDMDAQGRLLLPEKLRKLANMDKKIVLVGQLARFEIWQEETWDAKENEWLQTESADDLRELGDLNF